MSENNMESSGFPVKELIKSAIEARKKSYAPYSGYMVGAALLTADLRIYQGCNIENAAFTPTICAERTALFKAVSEGTRKFKAIAIVGSPTGDEITQYSYPCGVCRQALREFVNPKTFVVIVAKSTEEYELYTLDELLPHSFGPENITL